MNKIVDFFGINTISATFSSRGLKYLALRGNKGEERIDLRYAAKNEKQSPTAKLLITETYNFLETGEHNMPLDFSGFTVFQQQAFEVVGSIKPGTIRTYKEVAELLGKKGAAQAVGNAVAKNPVAYFLPTHRVLPKKGLGTCKSGAGLWREKLLELEGHDLVKIKGNYICPRKKCCVE